MKQYKYYLYDYVNDVEKDHEDYEWYMTAYSDKEIKDKKIYFEKTDKRWKEKFVFKGAQVVLFGNLYEPLKWSSTLNQNSSATVKVDGNILHLGTLVEETLEGKKDPSAFSINGVSVAIGKGVDRAEGYQAVKIVGDVAPMSVIINSSYTKDTVQDDGVTDSKLEEDATNYYFYGEGSIKDASKEDMDEVADTIVDMLNAEAMLKVRVAYGQPVNELKDVSKSYKEAKMALEVGNIFYDYKNVISYGMLGIGRLIYQLPQNLCKLFIREIYGDKNPDDIGEEILTTVNKFLENNLNVSETSRQLYIHRNTLVFRIEKLQKAIGLDMRVFEDALTFKIALMVQEYLRYLEKQE